MRAVAVLLVVAYHAGVQVPGGFVGVDIFFVISGYVIARMLLGELRDTGRVAFGRFYLRRIRRLLPALAFLTTWVLGASLVLGPIGGTGLTVPTGAAASVFSANAYLWSADDGGYFDVGIETNALLHTWSLAVEEQFYLVFPALLAGLWALARRARRPVPAIAGGVALLGAGSLVLSLSLTGREGWESFAFYAAPTRAWEFCVGVLLALGAGPVGRWCRGNISAAAALAGLAAVGHAGWRFDESTPFPGTAALVPVAGAALLVAAGEGGGQNPVSRWLSGPALGWVGDRSYSWYLWHWPFIVFATAAWPRSDLAPMVAALASLAPAWMSHRLVEEPIRSRRVFSSGRTVVLATACVAVPLLAAAGAGSAQERVEETAAVEEFESDFVTHLDLRLGCDDGVPLGGARDPDCVFPVTAPVGEAVLVGDSNAGQFTEPFVAAMRERGFTATVATMSGCPFVDIVTYRGGHELQSCRAFVEGTVDHLVAHPPDLVVIATSSDGYLRNPRFAFRSPEGGSLARAAEDRAALWEPALAGVLGRLRGAGIEVVLVHPIPKFPDWDPRACAVWRWATGPAACGASQSRDEADGRRATAVAIERRVAAAADVALVDPLPLVCPGQRCATFVDGEWWWRDGNHLTVTGALRMREVLREAAV